MAGDTRRPQTLGGAAYLAVLVAAGAALLMVVLGAWRTGITVLGASLLAAAGFRVALRETSAGMLRVRRKHTDVALLVLVGVALIVLANNIPDQPPG